MIDSLFRNAGDVISRLRRDQGIDQYELAKEAGITVSDLREIESGLPPTDDQLQDLAAALGVSSDSIAFLAGDFSEEIQAKILHNPDQALALLSENLETPDSIPSESQPGPRQFDATYETDLGELYQGDSREVMRTLEKESFDLIFADPPFNLDKDYDEESDDDLAEEAYLKWNTEWIDRAVDLLKPGGSFFLYNLPKWNVHLAHYLSKQLSFKHWIAVDIKFSLPIPGRLYPSHYSLLYFVKGKKPNQFEPPRLPIDTCPHCGGEQNDYGGYKDKLNPEGLNLTDVWDDIPPVRHDRYKVRDANQVSIKLLHRVLSIATKEGNRVLDPFGGSGTTFAASELMNREWVGIELHDCDPIEDRLENPAHDRDQIQSYESNQNVLFTEDAMELRREYKEIFNFNFEDYDLSVFDI